MDVYGTGGGGDDRKLVRLRCDPYRMILLKNVSFEGLDGNGASGEVCVLLGRLEGHHLFGIRWMVVGTDVILRQEVPRYFDDFVCLRMKLAFL